RRGSPQATRSSSPRRPPRGAPGCHPPAQRPQRGRTCGRRAHETAIARRVRPAPLRCSLVELWPFSEWLLPWGARGCPPGESCVSNARSLEGGPPRAAKPAGGLARRKLLGKVSPPRLLSVTALRALFESHLWPTVLV